MIQKIIKVGNSAAITIPKEFLQSANYKIGEEVALEINTPMRTLVVKPKSQAAKKTLTPEFKDWLDGFMEEYQPILEKLAHL
ncbi:AbrB/MazE/SpoVT family DNA-binding domain-containing protein [Candidatus Gottesmanbacteria bacterium]|nr:AbrB/MazE/SpoVT family DNA-binding domain-containing protein [Candidatus Gottesmanbacteria bacterium]